MKHIKSYSRNEIKACLEAAGLDFKDTKSTESLRSDLSVAIEGGDAPYIEGLTDRLTCKVCDESVNENNLREHAELHTPQATGMEHEEILEFFKD